MDTNNLLLQILESIKTLETKCDIEFASINKRLSNMQESIIADEVKIKTKKVANSVKKHTLKYNTLLQKFFDENKVEYVGEDSVVENMDKLCRATNTNIKVISLDKVIYENESKYDHVRNYTLTNNEGMVATSNRICSQQSTIMGVKKCANLEEGETKANYDTVNKLLKNDIFMYNKFALGKYIIKQSFLEYALEPTTDEENYINTMCSRGSVVYLKENNYRIKYGFSFDINSFHPHILGNSDFEFPIRAGKCVDLKTIDSSVPGLYAIKMEKQIKYFVTGDTKNDNIKIWYSHYHLQLLEREGIRYLPYICNEESKYNAIVYRPCDMIKSKTLFGNIVNVLFNEGKKNKVAKSINQTLFGTIITKSNNEEIATTKDSIDYETFAGINFDKVTDFDDNIKYNNKVETGDVKSCFDCCRMKIMFYDYCRVYLHDKYLKKYDPVRIYSDSFIVECSEEQDQDGYLDDIYNELGTGLGELKREMHYDNVVYPVSNFSFKGVNKDGKKKAVEGVYLYNKETEEYVQSW